MFNNKIKNFFIPIFAWGRTKLFFILALLFFLIFCIWKVFLAQDHFHDYFQWKVLGNSDKLYIFLHMECSKQRGSILSGSPSTMGHRMFFIELDKDNNFKSLDACNLNSEFGLVRTYAKLFIYEDEPYFTLSSYDSESKVMKLRDYFLGASSPEKIEGMSRHLFHHKLESDLGKEYNIDVYMKKNGWQTPESLKEVAFEFEMFRWQGVDYEIRPDLSGKDAKIILSITNSNKTTTKTIANFINCPNSLLKE